MMDDDEYNTKFISDINCISQFEIKEEVIVPDFNSDTDSTLSDNETSSDLKLQECSICCKYRSMFIILKNHDCQMRDTIENCFLCDEILHWINCFKVHQETHEEENENFHSSDSTTSDYEENDGKCVVCLKYEFMIPLLKSHICQVDEKCKECSEVLCWTACFKIHLESHETKIKINKIKEENFSDSTVSDNEEIQKILKNREGNISEKCAICLKYEVMLLILKENHTCDEKNSYNCEKCEEIFQWYECFENHKKTHQTMDKNLRNNKKRKNFSNHWSDCRICLTLNSIVTSLVKNHICNNDNKSCVGCEEVAYWLTCLKNHKKLEKRPGLELLFDEDEVEVEEKFETVKNSWHQTECTVCSKLDSAIATLKNHICQKKKKRKKCGICIELSFWSKNFKLHKSFHSKSVTPLSNFFSCSTCGKRFSSERMLNVHKHYCKNFFYTCEECESRFFDSQSLKNHEMYNECRYMPNNAKYSNKVYKKKLSSSLNLKNHKKFHEDFKLFKCTECLSKFKSEFRLKKHLQIHR